MPKILVIDDDPMLCDMLCRQIRYMSHEADWALTLAEGFAKLRSDAFDVVFLDVRLPDGNGLDAMPAIRQTADGPEVIIITGEGTPDGAELAVKTGAWDYIQKPLTPVKIMLPLKRVLQYRDSARIAREPVVDFVRKDIIGRSPPLMACLENMANAAARDTTILLTGETGTGKELFARAIHDNSRRSRGNFVVVDCAALPETLIESALFGHEKGAFTGADRSRGGLIGQADQGTLFLDEVGELDLDLQKSFLRVLQERKYRPVGGNMEISSDFRLITATNRDLDRMAQQGAFRKDLLYRLKTITIALPPLRERKGDIRALALHYAQKISQKYGLDTKGFAPEFLDMLSAYSWPGNIRELINAIEESVNHAQYEPTLFPRHLPEPIRIHHARRAAVVPEASPPPAAAEPPPAIPPDPVPAYREYRETVMAAVEKQYFVDLMRHTRGEIREACRLSGLGRSRLYALMKKHGVSRLGWS